MFHLNHGLLSYWFEGKDPIISADLFIPFYLIGIIFVMAASYLLGSINPAIIISKTIYHDDIRKHGSGNAGMTNMLRTYGKGAAGLTLLGDMMKTFIAIFIAGLLFGFNYVAGVSTGDGICYVAGLFVVAGHVFPCFYKFKGGKGVLATATMALILSPVPFLFLFLLFVLVVATSKYISLGSVTTAVLYPVVLNGYFKIVFMKTASSTPGFAALSSIILAILIVWCHRENLKRISERTENKFSFGKSKKSEAVDVNESAETSDEDDGE